MHCRLITVLCRFVAVALVFLQAGCGEEKPKQEQPDRDPWASKGGQMTGKVGGSPEVAPHPGLAWPAQQGGGAMTGLGPVLSPLPLSVLWSVKIGPSISGGAVVAENKVFVGDRKGTLHARVVGDGSLRWTYQAKGAITAAPLFADGRVYVGDEEGWFHCVEAATGIGLWSFETDGSIHSAPNRLDKRILFGSDDGRLRCCEPSGKVAWSVDTGDMVYNAPAVSGGRIYLSGCAGVLSCHDGVTGKELWARELGFHAPATPLPLKGSCLVATMDGRLCSVAQNGEKEMWVFQSEDASFNASPAAADGVAILGSDKDRTVYAVDLAKGTKLWSFLTRGPVKSPPVIAGKTVVVGCGDGKLYFLDLRTGRKLWEFLVGRGVEASPTLTGPRLLFGDLGGTLWCLGRGKR